MPPATPRRLLFVCTANICRSPMAEGYARHLATTRGLPLEVASGGVLGIVGRRPDPLAVRVMGEVGVDISDLRSSGLTPELIDWADHVLVMELRHQMHLHGQFPACDGKVLLLGSFGGASEVPDPIGGWRWRFRRTRELLVRSIDSFVAQLPPAG